MHEILLYGQVANSRHEQVLKVLAGVAAMQPQRVIERHAVYKPFREPVQPGRNVQVGGSQDVDPGKRTNQNNTTDNLYYVQLIQDIGEDDFGSHAADNAVANGGPVQDASAKPAASGWSFYFADVPEAGKRRDTLRMISQTDIVDGDPHAYMTALGYRYVSEYVVEGHRFVHGNVIIFVHRILTFPDAGTGYTKPRESFPPFDSMVLLDPSGAYIVQASVRVADGGNIDIAAQGSTELHKFQELMKGVINLDVVERLSLDTRNKWQMPKPMRPGQRPMA